MKKIVAKFDNGNSGIQQEEYMYENCRDNKYFLINLDTEVRNNDSITKIWLCSHVRKKGVTGH